MNHTGSARAVGGQGAGGRTFGLRKAQLLSSTPCDCCPLSVSVVCGALQWLPSPALWLVALLPAISPPASLFFHIFGGLAPSSGSNFCYLNYMPEGRD